LTNEDVEDLFRRVTVGTRVVVLPGAKTATSELPSRPKTRAMQLPEGTASSRTLRGIDPEGRNASPLLRSGSSDLPL
jgi:hypothetical protein